MKEMIKNETALNDLLDETWAEKIRQDLDKDKYPEISIAARRICNKCLIALEWEYQKSGISLTKK